MFDSLGGTLRDLLNQILPLYKSTDFAFAVAAGMCVAAAAILVIAVLRHIVQTGSLRARTRQISSFVTFATSPDQSVTDQERLFADRFKEIDAVMQSGGIFSSGLRHAWQRYRRTLSFVAAPPVRAAQRPNIYLQDAIPAPTWVGFLANLFVAFGLLATFLGLIAALTFATQGISSDAPGDMQRAMTDLLASAASKFITSVTGVGLSIVLRLAERLLTVDLRASADGLSNALEFGIRVDPDAHNAAIAERMGELLDRLDRAAADAGPAHLNG